MFRQRLRLAGRLVKQDRALARAAKRMPRPAPWEWARPRLVPLLVGPCYDPPGEAIVRAQAGAGCAVEFGLDLGGVFATVDERVAERWECTADQLLVAAMANLESRVEKLTAGDVAGGAFSGRIIRRLTRPRGCAASLVLVSDHLKRLFGEHDQVFATPSQSELVSFPITTPAEVIASAVVEMEMDEPLPLLYEPFVLLDGKLHWQPDDDDEPGFAERARSWPAA